MKLFLPILAGLLVVCSPSAYAAPSPTIDQSEVLAAGGGSAVLVDKASGLLTLLDLKKDKSIPLLTSDSSYSIQDVDLLPGKIVALQSAYRSRALIKTVFSLNGDKLSRTVLSLPEPGQSYNWIPPQGTAKERIVMQTGRKFSLYQAPWRKPVASYTAPDRRGTDAVSVQDWDCAAYPYLTLKYAVEGLMNREYFVETVNLYNRQTTSLTDFNTDTQLSSSRSGLALYTSYHYQAVPNHVEAPVPGEAQPYFRLYSASGSSLLMQLSGRFAQSEDGRDSGWATSWVDGYVFSGDRLARTWSLFDSTGRTVLKNEAWPLYGETLYAGYSAADRTAYFIQYTAERSTRVVPVQVQAASLAP